MKQKTQKNTLSLPSKEDFRNQLGTHLKENPDCWERVQKILKGEITTREQLEKERSLPNDVDPAGSKKYINAYHKERSLRLKKEISQQQPISLEEFVNASKIANRGREQQTSG